MEDYNDKLVKGSKKFKRKDVNKLNVNQLLAEKYNVKDFTPLANSSVLSNFSEPMLKAIKFKFQRGQRVLLSRSANYTLKSDKFAKPSAEGSYSKKVYTIDQVYLKTNAKQYLTMFFTIKGLLGKFYPTEMVPANFSEPADAVDEDAKDRKIALAKAKKKKLRE